MSAFPLISHEAFLEKIMMRYREFYEKIDRKTCYAPTSNAEEHSISKQLKAFIDEFNLYDKKCLEIGSGKGLFQHLVVDYTGLEIAESLAQYYEKPIYFVNPDGTYPFPSQTFDAIWSHAVHEHIPDLDRSLQELKRVLKSGGLVFFSPAWQCRPWAAEGYAVRSYGELDVRGMIIKALIPLRDSIWWRSLFIFPKRLHRHILFLMGKRYSAIPYKQLQANYEHFWTSDSDACKSIDPHDAILWFESNGFRCLSHPMHLRALLVRTGPLIFERNKLD